MLKTKPAVRTAAKTVTAAATGGVVLVHSVKDRSALSSLTASAISQGKGEFSCTSCGTHIVASSHAAPICTTCGCETKKVRASAKADYKSLVAIRCGHCDSVHLMEPGVIQASGHKVHCTVCGGSNSYKPEVIESASKLFANTDEDLDDPAEDTTAEADEWPEFEEASSEEEDEEITFEDVPEPTAAATEDDPKEDDPKKWPFEADADDPDLPTDPAVESAADDEDEDEDSDYDDLAIELEDLDDDSDSNIPPEAEPAPVEGDSGSSDEDEEIFVEGNNDVVESNTDEVDEDFFEVADLKEGEMLADAMGLDDTNAGLSFQATAGRLVAMKGHVAVASLKREQAGKNVDVMFTAGFAAAIKHAAGSIGMRKALISAGFTPIRIQSLSKASVARKVQEVQQASANSVAKQLASFSDSLALASAGLARGNWKGKKNPLKSAFVEAFAQFGVKNPERVVARILAEQSVPFARTLVEIATELNSLSPETRKETARMLELTEVVVSSNDEETDDTPEVIESSDIAGRLRTTAAVLPSVLSHSVALTKYDASQQSVQARATSRALDILDGNAPLNTLG